jgi:PhnB protein
MADGALVDRLDQTIDDILARRDATSALRDAELTRLAVLAAELRYVPSAAFRSRLRATLERRTTMTTLVLDAKNIREGFTTVTPYVMVPEAGLLDFLERVFNAEETFSVKGSGGGMHREVRLGNSMLMIGEGGAATALAAPAAFHVYVPDADAAFQRALDAGGTSMGDPADRPYGERAGFISDRFGNHWYIATLLGGASHAPEGRRTVTPFIHPKGVAAYVEFLKRAFNAEEEFRHETEGVIRHLRLQIGNSVIEMGDTEGATEPMKTSFYLYVPDVDALYAQAVAAGATPLSPPADQSYGDRMGSVQDSQGITWYISRPA